MSHRPQPEEAANPAPRQRLEWGRMQPRGGAGEQAIAGEGASGAGSRPGNNAAVSAASAMVGDRAAQQPAASSERERLRERGQRSRVTPTPADRAAAAMSSVPTPSRESLAPRAGDAAAARPAWNVNSVHDDSLAGDDELQRAIEQSLREQQAATGAAESRARPTGPVSNGRVARVNAWPENAGRRERGNERAGGASGDSERGGREGGRQRRGGERPMASDAASADSGPDAGPRALGGPPSMDFDLQQAIAESMREVEHDEGARGLQAGADRRTEGERERPRRSRTEVRNAGGGRAGVRRGQNTPRQVVDDFGQAHDEVGLAPSQAGEGADGRDRRGQREGRDRGQGPSRAVAVAGPPQGGVDARIQQLLEQVTRDPVRPRVADASSAAAAHPASSSALAGPAAGQGHGAAPTPAEAVAAADAAAVRANKIAEAANARAAKAFAEAAAARAAAAEAAAGSAGPDVHVPRPPAPRPSAVAGGAQRLTRPTPGVQPCVAAAPQANTARAVACSEGAPAGMQEGGAQGAAMEGPGAQGAGHVLGRASAAAEAVARATAGAVRRQPLSARNRDETRAQSPPTFGRAASCGSLPYAPLATPSRSDASRGGAAESESQAATAPSDTPPLARGMTDREKRAIAAERRLAMLPR